MEGGLWLQANIANLAQKEKKKTGNVLRREIQSPGSAMVQAKNVFIHSDWRIADRGILATSPN